MKTYIEAINVVLNDNYSEAERFSNLKMAIERYEEIKKSCFDEAAVEVIFESGERSVANDEDTLNLEFIYKTCQDDEFEMLHPASIISHKMLIIKSTSNGISEVSEPYVNRKNALLALRSIREIKLKEAKSYNGLYVVTEINNDGFSYLVGNQLTTVQVEEAF